MNPRVALVYEWHLFRFALASVLSTLNKYEIVSEVSSCDAMLQCAGDLCSEIIVSDMWFSDGTAVTLARRLARARHRSRVLVFATKGPHEHVEKVFQAGAYGYLGERSTPAQLAEALAAVASGGRYLDATLAGSIVCTPSGMESGQVLSSLPVRELDVFRAIADGQSTKEIAQTLGIGIRTTEGYRSSLMKKLGVHNVAQLVRAAV